MGNQSDPRQEPPLELAVFGDLRAAINAAADQAALQDEQGDRYSPGRDSVFLGLSSMVWALQKEGLEEAWNREKKSENWEDTEQRLTEALGMGLRLLRELIAARQGRPGEFHAHTPVAGMDPNVVSAPPADFPATETPSPPATPTITIDHADFDITVQSAPDLPPADIRVPDTDFDVMTEAFGASSDPQSAAPTIEIDDPDTPSFPEYLEDEGDDGTPQGYAPDLPQEVSISQPLSPPADTVLSVPGFEHVPGPEFQLRAEETPAPAALAPEDIADDIHVRRAIGLDAEGIAIVHARAWRSAFTGERDDTPAREGEVAARARKWEGILKSQGDRSFTVVALAADASGVERIVGFCSALTPSRDRDADGKTAEIATLYVDPGVWRQSVGTELVNVVLSQLVGDGWEAATLWILENNIRGQKFFEAFGFEPDGTQIVDNRSKQKELRMFRSII